MFCPSHSALNSHFSFNCPTAKHVCGPAQHKNKPCFAPLDLLTELTSTLLLRAKSTANFPIHATSGMTPPVLITDLGLRICYFSIHNPQSAIELPVYVPRLVYHIFCLHRYHEFFICGYHKHLDL